MLPRKGHEPPAVGEEALDLPPGARSLSPWRAADHTKEGSVKRLTFAIGVMLLAGLLASCTFPGSKLKPGDTVGDMELTTEFDLNIHSLCSFDELAEGTCQIPSTITEIGISTGWFEITEDALNLTWLDSTWTMTFDGREVDLASFGTFDLDWEGQKARVWDVGITNPAPGKHTVHYEFNFKNGPERGNHFVDYIFTVIDAPPTLVP